MIICNLGFHCILTVNLLPHQSFVPGDCTRCLPLNLHRAWKVLTKRTDKNKITKKMIKNQQQQQQQQQPQQPQQEREKIMAASGKGKYCDEINVWSWCERKVKKMEFAKQNGRYKWKSLHMIDVTLTPPPSSRTKQIGIQWTETCTKSMYSFQWASLSSCHIQYTYNSSPKINLFYLQLKIKYL